MSEKIVAFAPIPSASPPTTSAVDLTKDQRGSLIERKTLERLPDARRGLLARQLPIREHLALGLDVAELFPRFCSCCLDGQPPCDELIDARGEVERELVIHITR